MSGSHFFPAVQLYTTDHLITPSANSTTTHSRGFSRSFQIQDHLYQITTVPAWTQDVFLGSLWGVDHVFCHAADSP